MAKSPLFGGRPPEPEPEPQPTPVRDPVRHWRYTECLRLVGLDHADEFAATNIDLHKLERMVRAGATPQQLKEWMLGD